ncbi:hypothetical protein AGRA3207_003039 [Actinomadura graeca]|uniref:DUF3558 domain-containing protein n=1 Tax=Actinomadura graeca TaxID=2750812 RepID=A0ABX8QTK2_9ACTN|nr:hypothetical protein [Actinomadura graeca]QXJ22093.1 hypothetical protein AGRA3207_003039 [Actinomadura graeca]
MMLVAALAIGSAACDGGSRKAGSAPDLRPITDSVPYLCDLVPETAFRRSTGLTMPVTVRWSGPQTDNGLCLAHVKEREAPLGIVWSFNDGDKTADSLREKLEGQVTHPIPAELGKGLAVVVPTAGAVARPNYVIAVFSCGKKRPWISIDFAPVVRGRDAVRDMVDFMRIAERRFGEIHRCGPKPA